MSWVQEKLIRERLAAETGTIYKDGPVKVALAYTNRYSVAMASLGYQVIYRMFNDAPEWSCERVFLPDDVAAQQASGDPLLMYESRRPAAGANIIAISMSFELDLVNLVRLLEFIGLEPLRERRGPDDPFIMVGGPMTSSNPFPIAPFADAITIGDGELIVPSFIEAYRNASGKADLLDWLDGLPGIYLPDRHGQSEPMWATAPKEKLPAYAQIVTPQSELSNMFLVEAQRGCPRPCTFCLARTMYGPNRNGDRDRILEHIPEWVTKVGLVGAALSDYPHTKYVGRKLIERGVKLGVSSIRADTVDEELAEVLKQGGLRTFTVASDAASQRLRDYLKKGIDEDDLIKTARIARDLGFAGLKVYMMIGLPPETDEDIDELIAFTKELASYTRITMGISPFVPKRHTPHHADPFAGIKTIDARLKTIKKGLRGVAELRNVSAKWAWIESVIARGGPEVGLAAYSLRDGESYGAWRKALAEVGWHDPYANDVAVPLTPA